MDNERLTPFERIASTEEIKLSGPQMEPVDVLINQRKKLKKQLRRNRWLKRLGVFSLTLTLVLLSSLYLKTSLSTLNQIEITGNQLLTKQEIIKQLQLNEPLSIWELDLVELQARLDQLDLVLNGHVSLENQNTIKIELIEKRGVALLVLDSGLVMLSDQGEFIDMDAHKLLLNMNLPLIIGLEDAIEILDLALILGTLNDEILVNISEIHKERTAFNEAQLRLMMQEGNTIFAPLSALSALDKYIQVLKMTNEKNSCFTIADISFSLVKSECPTH
ncbi:MAG: FtsQ-type POTRA domain-containing protein [Erysipelotrichaceae bacterium]|nr:FtsQ-type POTRA domain-containing protein [Erysipelotrichaceae bacterium]